MVIISIFFEKLSSLLSLQCILSFSWVLIGILCLSLNLYERMNFFFSHLSRYELINFDLNLVYLCFLFNRIPSYNDFLFAVRTNTPLCFFEEGQKKKDNDKKGNFFFSSFQRQIHN